MLATTLLDSRLRGNDRLADFRASSTLCYSFERTFVSQHKLTHLDEEILTQSDHGKTKDFLDLDHPLPGPRQGRENSGKSAHQYQQ